MKVGLNFICGGRCSPVDGAGIRACVCCLDCPVNTECAIRHKCGASQVENKNIMIAQKSCGKQPTGKIYDIDVDKLKQYIK